MPIVDVRFVASARPEAHTPSAQELADALGRVLGSDPGRTWVRLHRHDISQYAENETSVQTDELPVFATLLLATMPDIEARAEHAGAICSALSRCFGRPLERIHLEYAPSGTGRVAFGGVLMG